MDKIKKLLKKLSKKDREKINLSIDLLRNKRLNDLDIKKIKNSKYFRLRVSNFRVIFYYKNGVFFLINISPMNENTYKILK